MTKITRETSPLTGTFYRVTGSNPAVGNYSRTFSTLAEAKAWAADFDRNLASEAAARLAEPSFWSRGSHT